MSNTEYITDDNHIVHEVPPMEDICFVIQLKYDNLLKRYKKLEEENQQLRLLVAKGEFNA